MDNQTLKFHFWGAYPFNSAPPYVYLRFLCMFTIENNSFFLSVMTYPH